MRLQGETVNIASERLPIDKDHPSPCRRQLRGIVQLRKLALPGVEKVPKSKSTLMGSLDMDDPIAGVRVKPVKAGTIGCNANALGNRYSFPFDQKRQMCMDVKDGILHLIAGNTINWEICCVHH